MNTWSRLRTFATEERTNNLDMPKFMQMLTERECNAFARYISALGGMKRLVGRGGVIKSESVA